jgi:hypothetical protein
MTNNILDAHAIDDELAPRTPVDSAARRVTARGVHFAFANKTDEVCSPTMLPTQAMPRVPGMQNLIGVCYGKLTVIGLATKENYGDGFTRRDPLMVGLGRSRRYKGITPDPVKDNYRNGTRWVCRCVCGMFTLRSGKAIKKGAATDSVDACVQCYQMERQRKGQDSTIARAREIQQQWKALRAKYGVECPRCKKLRPRSPASILLPGQICKGDGYHDPRPELADAATPQSA